MKILYQHRSLADGAEGIHISEMIDAFRELGHEVVVHAIAPSPNQGGGRPTLLGRIKRGLPQGLFEIATLAFNAVEYVGFRRSLRRHQPDLVYKRHAICDVAVPLAAKHCGVPLVLEVNAAYSSPNMQEFEPSRFPAMVRRCERKAFEDATVLVTVSTPLKAIVQAISPEAGSRARVLPNGANPTRFDCANAGRDRIRAQYGFDASVVVVGWVGILREWHRVELLLEAAAQVPSVHVLIIGDGPDQPRLERLIAELNLGERVRFTGRVRHREMSDYIAALDVAVVSDDRTGYASPMKMLEYMAMGRAIAAPRLSNIEDIVEHGRDGLLFTPRDAGDLASVLGQLATDPELREQLGRAARLKIERERNWLNIARLTLGAVADRLRYGSIRTAPGGAGGRTAPPEVNASRLPAEGTEICR
jgi:glycosyltransferase involved in cell wall biosynthesis